MAEPQSPNATSTETTRLAWAKDRPPQKVPEYYKGLKEKYEHFINGNELLLVPLLIDTVNTRTIPLLRTDVKTRKLIGVDRVIMEEALKSLRIVAKILERRSNAMWDILLATEDAANSLDGSITITKAVRLQTEYLCTST